MVQKWQIFKIPICVLTFVQHEKWKWFFNFKAFSLTASGETPEKMKFKDLKFAISKIDFVHSVPATYKEDDRWHFNAISN